MPRLYDSVLMEPAYLASRSVYEMVIASLDVKQSTLSDYKYRLGNFQKFIEEYGMQHDTLLQYKHRLEANEDYSISTKNKYLACARTFLRQCHELRILPAELAGGRIRFFKQSKGHKKFGLSEYEANRVRQWMASHPDNLRENAMLCLLLFQGLRQAEVCHIQAKDVVLRESSLFVLGKGRDDKDPVHLHPYTKKALELFLRKESRRPHDYIFTSNRRQSYSGRLTERGLRYIIKTILAELDIDRNVHSFRHYFTTRLIKAMPGELLKVSHFTRHSSLEMLKVYNDNIIAREDYTAYERAFA